MALAPFFNKASLAAAQFLRGMNPAGVKELLSDITLGIAFDETAVASQEGRWILEMSVNLSARLYPKLALAPSGESAASFVLDLEKLAVSINPLIELLPIGNAKALISVGQQDWSTTGIPCIYAGASGWQALLSDRSTRPLSAGTNPFGAGAAACLAAAQVFRSLFPAHGGGPCREEVCLSLLDYAVNREDVLTLATNWRLESVILVGAGAIGNATLWALKNSGVTGDITVVDPEAIDDTNLQRYVLSDVNSIGKDKVEIAREWLAGTELEVTSFRGTWSSFVDNHHPFSANVVATALDSALGRCEVQASLPKAILNAWTQTGDLGVSRHPFIGDQACLACLYHPHRVEKSEDQIVAEALKLDTTPGSASMMEVRNALYFNTLVDETWLSKIVGSLSVDDAVIRPFLGKPLRTLYQQGICGGAILLTDGHPVEVPMAFQSAMAGIMLAAELVKFASGQRSDMVTTKLNLMRPLGERLSEKQEKTADGNCLCQDRDFIAAYQKKYAVAF